MLRFSRNLLLVTWFGLCTAALIQSHRPASWSAVRGLDAPTGKNPPPPLMDRMEQAAWRRNAPLELSEVDVNRYLAMTVHGTQGGISKMATPFDRVALDFEPGHARVCLAWGSGKERKATASLDFTVERQAGDFVIEVQRGSLGRLPVPRGFLCTMSPALDSLCASLNNEIRTVFQMNRIRFEKDKVILDPRPETVK